MHAALQEPAAFWGRISTRLRERIAAHPGRALAALPVAAALLALLAGWLGRGGPAGGPPLAKVQRGDVRITLTESGELRAAEQTTVSAPTDKQIVWLVPEGAHVKAGDELVRFEVTKWEIIKGGAESSLAVARAELQRALSDREARKATEQKAWLDYQALPELAAKGFINRSELDSARLGYEEVKAANRAFDAGVTAARANVERAEQDVKDAERKLAEGVLRAPRDGVVVYAVTGDAANPRKLSVGMTPFEGMDLMYLPDPSHMIVETEISEFDLAKVAVGGRAELRLDAWPDAVFEGEVAQVGSLARQKISPVTGKPTGLKVFDAVIRVKGEDERLKPGLSATVELLVSEHPGALWVPLAAVFVDELDRTIVYRRGLRGAEAQVVELGGSTDRVAIVRSGLEEGDEILLAPPEPS
jgi:RND family efflux transporter MFP subunit